MKSQHSQMTIGKKLFWNLGALVALTLAISSVALWDINGLGKSIHQLVYMNAAKRYLASDINTTIWELIGSERGIIARSLMHDQETVQRYNREYGVSLKKFKQRIGEFRPLIETAEALRLIDEMQIASDSLGGIHDHLYQLATSNQAEAAAAELRAKAMPLLNKTAKEAQALAEQQGGLMKAVVQSAEGDVSFDRWTIVVGIGVCFALAFIVVVVVRRISSELRRKVSELTEASQQVASASEQISNSSQALAQGASQQAASLEETSASSNEINSMASKNAENSRTAASLVAQSQQKFAETNQALELMVAAMGDISASSDKIAKIIKVIDEIAFQTNILALNAAVEAARAGEAGMGFAVVADEVRNLSQRCAQAAKDTAGLIEESIQKASGGKIKVEQVAIAIRAITEESTNVKMLVDEVNLGSQDQTRGIASVSKAIMQMEQVTQTTAATAEESASASEELTAQAAALKGVALDLGVMVGGGSVDH